MLTLDPSLADHGRQLHPIGSTRPRQYAATALVRPFAFLLVGILGATSAFAQAPAPTPLDLTHAIDTANAQNPSVISARRAYEQALARVDQARAQTRPGVDFTSSVAGSDANLVTPPPPHETFATVQNSIDVPLPIGRRPTLALTQSRAQAAAAQAVFDGARRAVLGQVIADYFALLKAQAQVRDAQAVVDDAERQLDESRLRNKAGDVPDLDVDRAGTPVATAQSALIQARAAAQVARQTFSAALGYPVDSPVDVSEIASTPPGDVSEADVLHIAVEHSADVRAARFNIDSDRAAIETAKLWRNPALAIQVIDSRSGDVTSFSREDTVQATVTVPLSDGGLAQGQKEEAEAALGQAQADLDAATLAAQAAAAAAYVDADSARRVADANRTTLGIAQTAYDKTALGYKNGLFPLTDVLDAQASLVQARNAYTQSLYDAAEAAAQLDLLLGRLTPVEKELTR